MNPTAVTPDQFSTFGELLRHLRRQARITQRELAIAVGYSDTQISRIEQNQRVPDSTTITALFVPALYIEQEPKWVARLLELAKAAHIVGTSTTDNLPMPTTPNNLPNQLTSFIGREKEQKEIADLIPKNRLVTLTGTGGIGKSRLVVQTALALLNDYPNGTWLVELAPLSDPAHVPQTVATTLGMIEQAGRPPISILTDFLRTKQALLILDNCEHLIQACAQLVETLLRACPDLHILASSREALGIPGETQYLVPGLTTPDPTYATFETLADYEAVQLFVERAQTAFSTFSMTRDNTRAIAQVCYHLDGIPLALELAAARVNLLRVEEIAARLYDRFRLLTSGVRTALPRHQTLRAMIDWSHDLLSEPERVLFRRLSVFAGAWSLEAAEFVCSKKSELYPFDASQGKPSAFIIHTSAVLDLLTSLVNKSLVVAERKQGEETRYRMLETIRQYARDKLWAAGEGEMIPQRHLAYFVELAERAEPNLRAFDMVMWLDRLETELDNNRVALDWAQEGDVEAQLRLASALLWFWHIRGHKNEGVDWLERALSIEVMERGEKPLTPNRAMIRGKALNASGSLMAMFFEFGKAHARLEESLALFQDLGPAGKQGMAYALLRLGGLLAESNRSRAGSLLVQSQTLFREIGDKFGVAECLIQLAYNASEEDDDLKQAIILAEEQLALRREIGDQDGIATALGNLGLLAFEQDDYQKAITLHEESLAISQEVENKWALSFTLSTLGRILLWQRDYERATKICEEALAFAQEIGDRFIIALNFYSLGVIAWFRGDYERATQMIANSLAVFREVGHHWWTASSLHALGDIALAQGDEERAAQWYEAELALGRETQLDMIFALDGLGKVAWVQGDYVLATKRFEEELRMSRNADLKPEMCYALYGLGRVAQSRRDYSSAREFYTEAFEILRQRISPTFKPSWLKGYVAAVGYPLDAFAVLASAQNQMEPSPLRFEGHRRAIRLFGAAETLYPPLHFKMSTAERAEHDQAVAAARAALGEEGFATAWAEGKAMTMEQVIAYALKEDRLLFPQLHPRRNTDNP